MRTPLLSTLALLISLPALASINGTVINTDGQPVSGARVSIFAPETVEARHVRLMSKTPERTPLAVKQTDSKGSFSFDSPKEQPVVELRVDANGFAPDALRLLSDDDAGAIALITAPMQRGTITANGKPVDGATVVWMGSTTEFIAVTDAEGHYSAPDPAKWASRVAIIHPDYAIFEESSGFGGAPKGVDRALSTGVAITGRVISEDGQTPEAKAILSVDLWPVTATADDGTFSIAHVSKDWHQLAARSGNLAGVRARSSSNATIRLTKAAKLTGSIRDTKNQLPVVAVEVRLTTSGFGGFSLASAFTDAKGSFSVTIIPGQYNLVAVHPGSTIGGGVVSLLAAQTANKPLYAMPRARVSGLVLDDDKRAVSGARIAARPANRNTPMFMTGPSRFQQDATTYSAPDGRFVLRNAPTETDMQIDAAKKGFPVGQSASLRLTAGEKKSGVVIIIPRGVAFSGKVVDSNGRPLSGVGVEAVEAVVGPGGGMRRMALSFMRDRAEEPVRTASDGTFTLRVKEGSYDVVFKREGFASKVLRAQTVNATTHPVEVKLEPGVEITGRVVRGGAGVEGVNVNAFGEENNASAVTASDGSFTLSDLSPGQMMLAASKPDAFIQQIRPVTAPARDLVIEVPAGGRITGRVVDKSNKKPIASFQAGVSTSRSGGGMVIMTPPMMKPFTSDDGTFTLDNVPPGPTQLVVVAPGYTTTRIPGINVENGKTVDGVEVALDTGVKLIGRSTGSDGTALSGVTVRLNPAAGAARVMRFDPTDISTVTDPNGEYTLEAIDPGEKTFTFSRQGYLVENRTITLSGKEARLDVQLSSGIRLTGMVTTEGGVPVADASVDAMSASDPSFGKQGRTDANGNFQIEGVAPGHYTLTAAKPGLANGMVRDFDASAGVPARIVMKSGGTITGHVSGLTDRELRSTTVIASGPNGNASAEVDGSGSYRMEGAPTGTVRVSARSGQGFMAGGKTSPAKSVQIDPGASVQVDLEFKSATVIRGRVTRNGQPLANAGVLFMPRNAQSQTSASGTTDSSGSYEINGLDDASYNVSVMDFERTTPFSTTYDVHGSSTFDIDIKAAPLRGRVIDAATSEPIADAHVEIHSAQGESMLSSRGAVTDPSGVFLIDNVARGAYQAKAEKEGYGHQIKPISIGDMAPEDLEFKLSPSSGVTLSVVDGRDNRMLAANVVRIVDGRGQTIETGSFRYNNTPEPLKLTLSPGSYRVTLTAMGYAPSTVSVTSPSNQTVRMTPGGTLLLRSKSGSLRVRLLDQNGGFYPRGPNGIFMVDPSPLTTTLTNVVGGMYTLQVLDNTDHVVNTIPVTVIDGQQTVIEV